MNQENRELLLKDLCHRLPYGVKVLADGRVTNIASINCEGDIFVKSEVENEEGITVYNEAFEVLPFLRPMESMTEEEMEECKKYNFYHKGNGSFCNSYACNYEQIWVGPHGDEYDADKFIDYLASRHLDFRGLIPQKLALEALDGMYEQ